MLLYIFGPFDEPHAAHYVVAVFDAEYFSDLFRNGDSSTCDYFCEEGDVLLLDLNRQLYASGQMRKNPMI